MIDQRAGTARTALITGLGALALYWFTAAPGLFWQDSATHEYRILMNQPENPFGLALSHPLHFLLGRFLMRWEPANPARWLNLMSGFFGALGVGCLAALVLQVTRRPAAAYLSAAALACSFIYWQMSVVTETYTLAAALMVLEWLALWRYVQTRRVSAMALLFAFNGLHVANHPLGFLTLACYTWLLLSEVWSRKLRPTALALCGLTWILCASPYWLLVLQHYQDTHDLAGTLASAFFGNYGNAVLNWRMGARLAILDGVTLIYNFPSLALPIAFWGLVKPAAGLPRTMRRVLTAQFVIVYLFVARYTIADQYTFYVPVCALLALWFGLGLDSLWQTSLWRRWWRVLWPALLATPLLSIAAYVSFPIVGKWIGWLPRGVRHLPFRDAYDYLFVPWKRGEDSAQRFARLMIDETRTDDWLIADGTTGYPIAYSYQLDGGPSGLEIFAWRTDTAHPERPLLAASDVRQHLERGNRVLAVPHGWVREVVDAGMEIVEGEPLWQIRLRPVAQASPATQAVQEQSAGPGSQPATQSRPAETQMEDSRG